MSTPRGIVTRESVMPDTGSTLALFKTVPRIVKGLIISERQKLNMVLVPGGNSAGDSTEAPAWLSCEMTT
jgi:hypothetical protein